MKVSVVITVRNEAANIQALLRSLQGQANLHEVLVVDAESTDETVRLADEIGKGLPGYRLLQQACMRGEGRNLGVQAASGDLVAFIDGDCTAAPGWIDALQRAAEEAPGCVIAGRTELAGRAAYAKLDRVELEHKGQDTTWPSCNLAYPRELFLRLAGFDETFVTAEDIDLNYRAVAAGARIVHAQDAVVHARTRSTLGSFLRQAYWNGYGRKQLTRKHGRLWRDYKFTKLLRPQTASPSGMLRLGAGLAGYLAAKLGLGPRPRGARAKPRP